MIKLKIICPVCKGAGKIQESKNLPKNLLKEKIRIAKTLSKSGFSVREITKIMNYKSPRSIQIFLKS
jgi:hypothetical protein